jgi:hypothetical protein
MKAWKASLWLLVCCYRTSATATDEIEAAEADLTSASVWN